MGSRPFHLPYFDILLSLRTEDAKGETDFDFVHWGYWHDPKEFVPGIADYKKAQESMNDEVLSAAYLHDGMKVLDVGCGFGGTIKTLNENYSDMELTGVNIDPRQLEVAGELVKPRLENRVNWLEADAVDIPLPDSCFDVVLAVECIFHFPSRQRFLSEAARLLKPGGCLVVSDFCGANQVKNDMDRVAPKSYVRNSFLRRKVRKWFGEGYGELGAEPGTDPPYRQMARNSGLELTLVRDITTNTLPTYDQILHFIRKVKKKTDIDTGSFIKSTYFLKWVSKLGLLRYVILAFESKHG